MDHPALHSLAAGDLAGALAAVAEAACADAQGRDAVAAWLARARVLLPLGAIAEARAAAAEARNRSVREGWKAEAAEAYVALAAADLAEKRIPAAELALDKARELARDSAPARAAVAAGQAHLLWATRRFDELRAAIVPAPPLVRLRLEVEEGRWDAAASSWAGLPPAAAPDETLEGLLLGERIHRARGDTDRAAALRLEAEARTREWLGTLPPDRRTAFAARLRELGLPGAAALPAEESLLAEVARLLAGESRLAPVLTRVVDAALAGCGAECGYLLALGESGAACRVARHAGGREPSAAELDYSRRLAEDTARTGTAFASDDAPSDPRLADNRSVIDAGSRSVLCVPLRVQDRPLGALYLHSRKRSGLFGPRERSLASALADLAAVAIDRARLQDQAVLAQVLAEGPELTRALPRALELVVRALRADRGFLFTVRDAGKPTRVAAHPPQPDERAGAFSETLLADALRAGKPVRVEVPDETAVPTSGSIQRLGVTRALCIPVPVDDELSVVLYLEGGPETRELDEEGLPLLEAFARHLARALRVGATLERSTRTIQRLNAALDQGLRELKRQHERHGMVGRSAVMARVCELIDRFAPFPYPVLLTGETGTGKELAARAIHYAGARRDRPYLAVNCGAMPRELLESELFGHVRGAFTGADRDRVGLFEAAHTGTLLLDEVEAMSDAMQVGLLRILQEGEVRPIGGRESRKVDVRVLAATNQDLADLARHGLFRSDLLFRLQVFQLRLPPLRERREDIPDLVERLLARIAEETRTPVRKVGAEALRLLHDAPWEGNVRELENALKQAVAFSGEVIEPCDLPPALAAAGAAGAAGEAPLRPIDELWKGLIRQALDLHGGNISRVADKLGISRTTLYKRIRQYGLEVSKR